MEKIKDCLQTQWDSDKQEWTQKIETLQSDWESDEQKWNKEKIFLYKNNGTVTNKNGIKKRLIIK